MPATSSKQNLNVTAGSSAKLSKSAQAAAAAASLAASAGQLAVAPIAQGPEIVQANGTLAPQAKATADFAKPGQPTVVATGAPTGPAQISKNNNTITI